MLKHRIFQALRQIENNVHYQHDTVPILYMSYCMSTLFKETLHGEHAGNMMHQTGIQEIERKT